MMGLGMFVWVLMMTCIVLGYALIVNHFAGKEAGWIKMAGQIIAVIIAVVAVLGFIYGGIYAPMTGRGMMGHHMMMGGGMGMKEGGCCGGMDMDKDKDGMMGKGCMMPMDNKKMIPGNKMMMKGKMAK